MRYRALGRTDIRAGHPNAMNRVGDPVSTVCMGGWSITGGRTWGPQDERDSIAAAGDPELPADVVAQLSAATEPVKARLGDNRDMWQGDSRMDRR